MQAAQPRASPPGIQVPSRSSFDVVSKERSDFRRESDDELQESIVLKTLFLRALCLVCGHVNTSLHIPVSFSHKTPNINLRMLP